MPLLEYKATPPWLRAARRRLIAMVPIRLMRHALYLMMIRRPGDFTEPETFNEKVNWRIFHDRRDRIVKACDKMWMKEMARQATRVRICAFRPPTGRVPICGTPPT